MTADEIRQKFLDFFKAREHAILPSAPLVTKDQKGLTNSTLFNTAGMQPLVPYLMGENHPAGKRLANSQKCIRTIDIDEVGDSTHATFFEMLGNWSLGDYFKEEAIKWSYEFLTDKQEGLGLDPARLYITVFEGDENAPKDEEAYKIWQKYVPVEKIFFMGAESNWWSAGDNGPCGPDTEMFYDLTPEGLNIKTKEDFIRADDKQEVVEIWNDVFMQYEKKDGRIIGKLKQFSVDTGSGLERITALVQGKNSIFDTDLFIPLLVSIKEQSKNYNEISARIVADHLKASVFIIMEGVIPTNSDRGYILRRLIRRAVRHSDILQLPPDTLANLTPIVQSMYQTSYFSGEDFSRISKIIKEEEDKFRQTLEKGYAKIKKLFSNNQNIKENSISAEVLFDLYQNHGFPLELSLEEINRLRREGGQADLPEDIKDHFEKLFQAHQEKSRLSTKQKFAGGLANHSEMSVKYHTATHLLHQALIDVLGDEVSQKGSNITDERLRFDFTYPEKLTPEQKEEIEALVNKKIKEDLPVQKIILSKAEAEKTGAKRFFNEKYGNEVSVFYIGPSLETAYSKEFCGGPHVDRTGNLGRFKIIKEESVARGVRRIKAVLN